MTEATPPTKPKHGGARPNSGPKNPPRLGRAPISISLTTAERERATDDAARHGLTLGDAVRAWGQGKLTFVRTDAP